jgi:hypothetical protein
MNCDKCPIRKNIKEWITFLRLLRVHQNKDYSTWKKIDELYEFLKQCDCSK